LYYAVTLIKKNKYVQVRMRDTFMKVGQSLLVKRQLGMEKQLKEKMIHSVMPPKVTQIFSMMFVLYFPFLPLPPDPPRHFCNENKPRLCGLDQHLFTSPLGIGLTTAGRSDNYPHNPLDSTLISPEDTNHGPNNYKDTKH
jgi:hypothetical protein